MGNDQFDIFVTVQLDCQDIRTLHLLYTLSKENC